MMQKILAGLKESTRIIILEFIGLIGEVRSIF